MCADCAGILDGSFLLYVGNDAPSGTGEGTGHPARDPPEHGANGAGIPHYRGPYFSASFVLCVAATVFFKAASTPHSFAYSTRPNPFGSPSALSATPSNFRIHGSKPGGVDACPERTSWVFGFQATTALARFPPADVPTRTIVFNASARLPFRLTAHSVSGPRQATGSHRIRRNPAILSRTERGRDRDSSKRSLPYATLTKGPASGGSPSSIRSTTTRFIVAGS